MLSQSKSMGLHSSRKINMRNFERFYLKRVYMRLHKLELGKLFFKVLDLKQHCFHKTFVTILEETEEKKN